MRLPAMPHRRLLMAAVIATGIYTLVTGGGATEARPPAAATTLPADAFRPVTIPLPSTPRTTRLIPVLLDDREAGREPDRPSSPRAPAAIAPPPAGPVHVVRAGDTLWQIGLWHRVEPATILSGNPDADPRRLVTGQRVLVPGGAPMPARAASAPPPARSTNRPAASARTTVRPRRASVPRASGGQHLWPLPIRGTITTRFSGGHPGIDIAVPAGTTVRAIAAGRVIYAGWKNNGGGFVVGVRHPDGMVSTYNHNERVAVQEGQSVEEGELLAWAGATGIATGPHLDLRIEMDGRLVDPLAVY